MPFTSSLLGYAAHVESTIAKIYTRAIYISKDRQLTYQTARIFINGKIKYSIQSF